MYLSRKCPLCKMDRIPDSEIVKEGKQKYVVYTCRTCKHHDIERWADRPRPKVWKDGRFEDDGSFFEEDFND